VLAAESSASEFPKETELLGHCAYANDMWRNLHESNVKLIFHGPQGYIPYQWYKHDDHVSTWNYVTLHISGQCLVTHDHQEKMQILKRMAMVLDKDEQLTRSKKPKFADSLISGIVGIRIIIENFTAKFKLSQNRDQDDFDGVIDHLRASKSTQDHVLADWMNKYGLHRS
jgi:transcriptional regulator